ncbi:N-acetyltransferase 14 [Varanus komodoensis]|uniref:Probable N-acetyltransferase 14 n=1 Tax=Varanus komodoensis TaxID=61221 RepID=A0A8D2KRQ7_VARKO|nr:N-acetyltransferase 14 [Varanus komodoensis]XP_044306034.1 N-acetyltransferase 14 [Varanus komodoensis]
MPTLEPNQLAIREMKEDEAPIVLDLLKDGFKDTENRLILYVLTRPLALLLMAVVSSGLRFFLNSFVVALVLPVLLTVVALKLLLRRSPDLKHLHAYYSVGQRRLWVAVYDEDDVCGCVALEPRAGEPRTAELKRLAVSRWYRRSGVGRSLLSFSEEQARAQGFQFLVAQVSVVTKAAIQLFESAGYSPNGGQQWLGYTIQQEFSKEL